MSSNLKKPPKWATVITKADVPKCEEEWTKFLFGKEGIPKEKVDLNIQKNPLDLFRSIERLSLTYKIESGATVEAYLLKPTIPVGNPPGIVLFHSSSPDTIEIAGSIDPGPQTSIAAHLAERGYLARIIHGF